MKKKRGLKGSPTVDVDNSSDLSAVPRSNNVGLRGLGKNGSRRNNNRLSYCESQQVITGNARVNSGMVGFRGLRKNQPKVRHHQVSQGAVDWHVDHDQFEEEEIYLPPICGSEDQQYEQEEAEICVQGQVEEDLVEARMVKDEESVTMARAHQVDDSELLKQAHKQQKEKECRRAGYMIIAFSLFILATSLWIDKVYMNKSRQQVVILATKEPAFLSTAPSKAPSSSPTNSMDWIKLDLPEETLKKMDNYSTPQYKAWDWLSNHQNLTYLPHWRKLQLFALATFYYSFEGERWYPLIRERWMDDTKEECMWFSNGFGFFLEGEYGEVDASIQVDPCSESGEFVSLYLQNLQLAGRTPVIPPEIALLTSLSKIVLVENIIETPIDNMLPSAMFQLEALQVLDLSWNSFKGTLPSQLGLMSKMTQIGFYQALQGGSIPSELGMMTSMASLWLNENAFTGSIPTELGMLTSLTELMLNTNRLTGNVPSELGFLTNLIDVALYANLLTGHVPSDMGRMTALTTMFLPANLLSGSVPSELGLMASLDRLYFSVNSLSGVVPSELGQLSSNLTRLWLHRNSLSGRMPSELCLLTLLESLNLKGNFNLSGQVSTEIGMMTALKWLSLQGNAFASSLPIELGMLRSLSSLHLGRNNFVGVIPSEVGLLGGLEELDLSNLPQLSGSLPSELALMTSLGYFNLSGSPGLSGTIPKAFCHLHQNASCGYGPGGDTSRFNCYMEFDCSNKLCGCDCVC